jgi:hypothetical protein
MNQITLKFSPDELATIQTWQAHGGKLTNAQLVRRALGFTVQQHGGIRKGGFELGNRHNPRIKGQR